MLTQPNQSFISPPCVIGRVSVCSSASHMATFQTEMKVAESHLLAHVGVVLFIFRTFRKTAGGVIVRA